MIPILTTLSSIQCPHGGKVILTTSNAVAQVDGGFFLLVTDEHNVVACPFTVPGPKPQPCVTLRWLVGASQTKVNQVSVLLQNSAGMCFSAEEIPQGPPVVQQVQSKASGS
jgi:hypothetical protein